MKRNNGPPFFVTMLYTNGRDKSPFQTELEEYLTNPLLVRNTQHFVCGNLNIDFMKANYINRNLANISDCSDFTLKTLKATTRLNHNGHSFCPDVFFSICKISKSGLVSCAANDHEMVYAVSRDDSVKHNAMIRDYRKPQNPETSIGAVIYLQKLIQGEYLNNFFWIKSLTC